jgi:hypothetical protein
MSDLNAEELQAELKKATDKIAELEKGGGGGDDLQAELDKLRGINKDLIGQRDAQKKKEEEAEAKRLEEQGEFKTLSEKLQGENKALSEKLEQLDGVVKQFNERDEQEFKTLLEKVPENLRGSLKESIPLADRLELARQLAGTKTGVPPKVPGEEEKNSITRQEFEAKPPTEQSKFIAEGGKVVDSHAA